MISPPFRLLASVAVTCRGPTCLLPSAASCVTIYRLVDLLVRDLLAALHLICNAPPKEGKLTLLDVV